MAAKSPHESGTAVGPLVFGWFLDGFGWFLDGFRWFLDGLVVFSVFLVRGMLSLKWFWKGGAKQNKCQAAFRLIMIISSYKLN